MFRRLAVLILSALTFGLLAAPSAFAMRQLIVFHTNVPLEVPGRVLNPGTYSIVQVSSVEGAGPVEIQNSHGKGIGDFLIQQVVRETPVNHTVLHLQKQADAPARIQYFIPKGHETGFKFLYPTQASPAGTAQAGNASVKVNG